MIIFDIETNGLLADVSKIHVICYYNTLTQTYTVADKPKDILHAIDELQKAECVCGHNIIDYDIPALTKLYPTFKVNKALDTMVLARLAWSDIKQKDLEEYSKGLFPGKLIGSHGLKAWGTRLGELKGDFGETSDWSEWTQEMSDYCLQDVKVTVRLWEEIEKCKLAEEAVELEHNVQTIISRQMRHGFLFDTEKAWELYGNLVAEKEILHKKLMLMIPPWWTKVKVVTPEKSRVMVKNMPCPVRYMKDCPYTEIKLNTFNPSSRDHIAYWFKKKYGWKPTEFSETGKPKVDEKVLSKLTYEEAPILAEYFLVEKRLGQLSDGQQAWLKNIGKDGRIHGYVNTNGAVTGRMTHSNPNVAQVPSVTTKKVEGKTVYLYGREGGYSTECRELFVVPKRYKLVGCDASGLELRCLAHYMARYDKGEYGKVILEGDIHSANQEAAGLPTRDAAKTFIYAFLYGAGDEKIGTIIGKGKADGKKLKDKFFKAIPAIKSLVDVAQSKTTLRGLDGRPLPIRSSHAALNVLLQSAGAVVMKKALVLLDNKLQETLTPGKDYEFVANIHDEFQIEVKQEHAEFVGQTAKEAIRLAGEHFKFRCPLDGEFKIGDDWKGTH